MITAAGVADLARRVTVGTVTLNAAIDKRYVVDGLPSGRVVRVRECTYSAGGKGLNVARVARIAGAEVVATGFLGGHAGRFIAEQVRAEGIADAFVEVAGESRSCINILALDSGETTELLEPGIEVKEADHDRLARAYHELLERVDVVTMSGSVPRGCPPDVYNPLVERARAAGRPVIVDTSGPRLAASVRSCPTLVKPNVDEVRDLVAEGLPAEAEDHVLTGDLVTLGGVLAARGVEHVVVSRGGQGALLVTAGGAWAARPPEVRVVNTVGCGDAMVAALAIGLATKVDPEDLITLAVGVASAAATSAGTGSFTPADLDDVLSRGVQVRPIH